MEGLGKKDKNRRELKKNLHNLVFDDSFLEVTPNTQMTKGENGLFGFHKN